MLKKKFSNFFQIILYCLNLISKCKFIQLYFNVYSDLSFNF